MPSRNRASAWRPRWARNSVTTHGERAIVRTCPDFGSFSGPRLLSLPRSQQSGFRASCQSGWLAVRLRPVTTLGQEQESSGARGRQDSMKPLGRGRTVRNIAHLNASMSPMSRVGMKSKTPERKRPEANTKVMLLWNFGKPGGFFRVREHMSVEIDMRRPIAALVLTAGLAMATVAPPSQAQAQGRDWGWGVVAGFVAGAAIANSTPGYPGATPIPDMVWAMALAMAMDRPTGSATPIRLTTAASTGRTTATLTRVPGRCGGSSSIARVGAKEAHLQWHRQPASPRRPASLASRDCKGRA
jgi:hypothetical protein